MRKTSLLIFNLLIFLLRLEGSENTWRTREHLIYKSSKENKASKNLHEINVLLKQQRETYHPVLVSYSYKTYHPAMLRASVTNDSGSNINVGPYLRPAEVS